MDEKELIEEYVDEKTWRTKSNANWNRSFNGMQMHISGSVMARHALNSLGKFGKRHNDGNYHLHNLEGGIYGRYCNGNDLMKLLQIGLINVGGINAKPAKHFATALDQISNFTYLMTGEFQGAQAWRDLDILLAPYIYADRLNYIQVKQEIQQLIWNLSFNMRPGYQTPFTNITLGIKPSKFYEDLPVLCGHHSTQPKNSYFDYQDEIELFDKAFLDILIESPDGLNPFTFPLPTINITGDFEWDSVVSDKIFELAAKWGTPYFANYINTDMSVEDALSMCCRLRLDVTQIQKVSGGIWNFGSNTGSLAVFTINMPRIGYLSNGNEKKFYRILDRTLDDGKEYLIKKKTMIKKGHQKGLFPMTDAYIGDSLFRTYFLTIGIVGLNECSLNFCEQNILENSTWCEEILKYISERVLTFQKETGHLFNFEATPAEGCSYSLARLDREKFPDISTQGTDEAPYYTGSSLIPSNIELCAELVLNHQEKLQRHYNGGTVLHIDEGRIDYSPKAVKTYIRRTCENYSLPYITWSPTYTSCEDHGKTGGRGCGCEKAKVNSRVVGYYRPVERWNVGKKQEFDEKKFIKSGYIRS